jgi:hypothetical protein
MSRSRVHRSVPLLLRVALVLLLAAVSPTRAQLVFAPPLAGDDGGFGAPGPAALGDIDGDGHADLLLPVTPGAEDTGYSLLPGDGAGSFGAPDLILPGWQVYPHQLALADVDGDGVLDVVAMTGTSPPALSVALGFGDGTFAAPAVHPVDCCFAPHAALDVADADADGDPDVLVVVPGTAFNGQQRLLFVNDGSGAFSPLRLPVHASAQHVDGQLADVDGDGLADVLGTVLLGFQTATPAVSVLLAQTGGGYTPAPDVPDVRLVDAADLDGDGALDLLVAHGGPTQLTWYGVGEGDLAVRYGLGDGTFVPGPGLELPAGSIVRAPADLDGDGVLDAFVEHLESSTAVVHRGLGGGAFDPTPFAYGWPPASDAFHPVLADVDADGRSDLVTRSWDEASSDYGFAVALNHTYGPGEPWLDLGHALAGGQGFPILLGEGSLVGGQPWALQASGAPAFAPVHLVAGLGVLGAPFKGGVMVPQPDALLGPFATGAAGSLALGGAWPAGLPTGLSIVLQAWFADAGGPAGFASTSGLQLTVP